MKIELDVYSTVIIRQMGPEGLVESVSFAVPSITDKPGTVTSFVVCPVDNAVEWMKSNYPQLPYTVVEFPEAHG